MLRKLFNYWKEESIAIYNNMAEHKAFYIVP